MSKGSRGLLVAAIAVAVLALSIGALVVYRVLTKGSGYGHQDPNVGESAAEARIAYVSDLEGVAAVYTMSPEGQDVRRLSGDEQGFCLFPSWSPDGRLVASWCADENPFPFGTGDIGVVPRWPRDDPPVLNLYSSIARSGVWVFTADGSERALVSGDVSSVYAILPTWSPDGTRLAFAAASDPDAGTGAGTTIYIARADGTGIERRIGLPLEVRRLSWSPGGDDLLIVGGVPDAGSNVYLWSAEGQELIEVTRGAAAADWSPDGEEIVVTDTQSRRVLIISGDLEPRTVAQFGGFPLDIAWSPDGRQVAVGIAFGAQLGFPTSIHVVTLQSGEVTIAVDNEGWIARLGWSGDSTFLLFTLGRILHRRPDADLPNGNLWRYDLASEEREQFIDLEHAAEGVGFIGLGACSP